MFHFHINNYVHTRYLKEYRYNYFEDNDFFDFFTSQQKKI